MSDTIDVRHAADLLERLAPLLGDEERALRAQEPTLGDDAVHAGALRGALDRLGASVSRPTFDYLTWKLDRIRDATPTPVDARPSRPRRVRADADAPAHADADTSVDTERDVTVEEEARALRVPRLMCDAAGARWVVSEVAPIDPSGVAGGSVLRFVRARERRHQSVYPHDWRSLPNEALDAFLPPP